LGVVFVVIPFLVWPWYASPATTQVQAKAFAITALGAVFFVWLGLAVVLHHNIRTIPSAPTYKGQRQPVPPEQPLTDLRIAELTEAREWAARVEATRPKTRSVWVPDSNALLAAAGHGHWTFVPE